jgi:Zn-dependent protease
LVHNLGHAWAARRVGYPMSGILFWGLLASSLYPPDEPLLPGRVHIRRALGGPLISLLASLASAVFVLALIGSGVWWYLALFYCLDNFIVFTLGALLPMPFTDGGTILAWRGKP